MDATKWVLWEILLWLILICSMKNVNDVKILGNKRLGYLVNVWNTMM